MKDKMQKGIKWMLWGLLTLLFLAGLGGCQGSSGEGQKEEGNTKTAAADALSETTRLPDDGVITAEQLMTVAGTEGTYRFTGTTDEGVSYVWSYDAKLIRNPQDQHLKVEVSDEETKEVMRAANDAQVGIGIALETMNLAAPARLELTLTEKWDADAVIFCKYQDGKALRIANAEVLEGTRDGKEVTVLTFPVTVTGDVFYLVGGNTKAGEDTQQTAVNETDGTENGQTGEGNAGTEGSSENTGGSQGDDSQNGGSQEANQNGGQDNGNQDGRNEEALTCTISIQCGTILDNWDDLKQSKAEFVPADGWILYPSTVEFAEGDTVFDVLKAACQAAGIQMESSWTPMYNSYYVEGINQLYEFDCGSNSGWMYRVNGWHPNYGSSSYAVSNGDKIEWVYTCDLGVDVGGGQF